MEFNEKANEILQYLDKNYYIKDKRFFTRYLDIQEWGYEINQSLPTIFSYDKEFCDNILKNWIYSKEFSDEEFQEAWGVHKLKTTWSPELALDLQSYIGVNAEAELTAMLSEQIAAEIDAQILRDLNRKIKPNELLGIVKCLGYDTTETVYDPYTFAPRKQFVSMKYNEIEHERQTNTIWQDYFRTRGQDQET